MSTATHINVKKERNDLPESLPTVRRLAGLDIMDSNTKVQGREQVAPVPIRALQMKRAATNLYRAENSGNAAEALRRADQLFKILGEATELVKLKREELTQRLRAQFNNDQRA